MTKIHKIINYDHEIIKDKNFDDIYKDPDIIKLQKKEKFANVLSKGMIILTIIALLGICLTTLFEWGNNIFLVFAIITLGAITSNYLIGLTNWTNLDHKINIIRVETADILYDRHVHGAKIIQVLLSQHDDDFCIIKVIAERDNEEVDETDLLLYYREKGNLDEPVFDVKECTLFHPKN